jgi:hypothetical protein
MRTLRRDVVTIVGGVDTLPPKGSGSSNSIPYALEDNLSLEATRLASLKYPPQYLATAQATVARIRSLAAALRSGEEDAGLGTALTEAINAIQQLDRTIGIPSDECITTYGS